MNVPGFGFILMIFLFEKDMSFSYFFDDQKIRKKKLIVWNDINSIDLRIVFVYIHLRLPYALAVMKWYFCLDPVRIPSLYNIWKR